MWLQLVGAIVFLALAVLAGFRGKQNPLARVLALLCLDLFAYTSFSLMGTFADGETWRWRERAAAALAACLGLHLIVAFVGARKRMRPLLLAAYLYFGVLAALCVLPSVGASLLDTALWARCMLIGMGPVFAAGAGLVLRHHHRERGAEERMRTYLMMGALGLGVGGATTDLIALAGVDAMPRLSSAGLTLSALVLSAAVLRFRVIRGRERLAMVHALVVATLGVVAQIALFAVLGEHLAFLGLGTALVLLTVLVAARPALIAYASYRERTAYLVTLGRLSAQMAHDVRNPLSAIRGAAQFLEHEARDGRTDMDMLELIVQQADRLERVVADYRRYGRVEPERRSVQLNELVENALRACEASLRSTSEIRVERALAAELPRCELDPDLVSGALENLIRNACEAMPEGGTLRVQTGLRGRTSQTVSISDTGVGMDARARERVFESFFSTKEEGTGLGLPFVQRVAEVHGGSVSLTSGLGRGTRVDLEVSRAGGR